MLVSALYPVTFGHFITYDFTYIFVKRMQREGVDSHFFFFYHSRLL